MVSTSRASACPSVYLPSLSALSGLRLIGTPANYGCSAHRTPVLSSSCPTDVCTHTCTHAPRMHLAHMQHMHPCRTHAHMHACSMQYAHEACTCTHADMQHIHPCTHAPMQQHTDTMHTCTHAWHACTPSCAGAVQGCRRSEPCPVPQLVRPATRAGVGLRAGTHGVHVN